MLRTISIADFVPSQTLLVMLWGYLNSCLLCQGISFCAHTDTQHTTRFIAQEHMCTQIHSALEKNMAWLKRLIITSNFHPKLFDEIQNSFYFPGTMQLEKNNRKKKERKKRILYNEWAKIENKARLKFSAQYPTPHFIQIIIFPPLLFFLGAILAISCCGIHLQLELQTGALLCFYVCVCVFVLVCVFVFVNCWSATAFLNVLQRM